jgi:hypothetical protein
MEMKTKSLEMLRRACLNLLWPETINAINVNILGAVFAIVLEHGSRTEVFIPRAALSFLLIKYIMMKSSKHLETPQALITVTSALEHWGILKILH